MRIATWRDGPHHVLHDADLMPQPAPASFLPDTWAVQQRLAGSAPGRGAVAFVRSDHGIWALRHYRRGGLAARLAEDDYLWTGLERSRPWREFDITAELFKAGLPVPRPVAAHVERRGWFYRGDLITVRISGAQPLADMLAAEPLSAAQWRSIGHMLRRFHDAGLRHDDINVRNVLGDAHGEFYLIDFDKAQIRTDRHWQAPNLRRFRRSLDKLCRSQPRLPFSAAEWKELLVGYASD